MPVFTFYLHETEEAVPAFEIALLEDATFALDHGKRILKERPRYRYVEIVNEDVKVGEISRDGADDPVGT